MNIKPESLQQTKENIVHVIPDKKQKFHGTFKAQRGYTVFKYDPLTNTMEPAKYELLPADFRNLKKIKKKVVMEPGCDYISALNKKNAAKKLGIELATIK